jgi:hypothetical protein
LVELVIASLLVACTAGLVLPSVSWIMVQQRAALQRQAAAEELANVMDQLTRRAWPEITPEQTATLGLAPAIERQLPEAKLTVMIDTGQDAKRIQLSLSWSDRRGRAVSPVRLTTWVYRRSAHQGDASPSAEDDPAPADGRRPGSALGRRFQEDIP